MLGWALLCGGGCAGVLLAEHRRWHPGVWICKPLAATAFLGAALQHGALGSTYGRLVLGALVLCWLGDVLLIPEKRPELFLAGIGSFLAGHVVFAAAFASRGIDLGSLAIWGAAMGCAAALALRWLVPHVEGIFRVAVPVYTIVIAAMVALAAAASHSASQAETAAEGLPTMLIGALAFAISDLAVARERFVRPAFANGAWGLPLYFAAQLTLAGTVTATL